MASRRQPTKRPGPKRLWQDRRGSVAVTVALALAVMIAMASLGVEVTYVLLKHRQMQAVVDAAAMAGAGALASGNPNGMTIEADAVASASGFTPGIKGVTITVNSPPVSGPRAGVAGVVEVTLAQPQSLLLANVVWSGTFTNKVRSVAALVTSGSFCVLQLDSAPAVGVTISNGAVVDASSCGLAVDSNSATALSVTGGANLKSPIVSVVGGATVRNGATINPSSALKTGQPAMADPYASVAAPSASGCAGGSNRQWKHSNSGTQTINPGVYCNGMSFTNDAVVTMNPGVYVLDRGTFDVGGAVRLTGTGVTIFLTSFTGSNYAKVNIGNGARVTLSAPTTNATAGLVFFGDRRAPPATMATFGGGATMFFTGALYFPSTGVTFANGITNPSGCTQLVAGSIIFQGGSKFQNNCPVGVRSIGTSSSTLVE